MFSRRGMIGIFIVAGLIATTFVIIAIRNSNPRELAGHKHAIKHRTENKWHRLFRPATAGK